MIEGLVILSHIESISLINNSVEFLFSLFSWSFLAHIRDTILITHTEQSINIIKLFLKKAKYIYMMH